jgi:hypothetical protein
MKNNKYLYNKSQYSFLIILIIVCISVFIVVSKMTDTILSLVLLNYILLLFHKLTITIDEEKITAKFAFGIIKKSVKLADIDFNTIEKIKTNWLTGIGIRITTLGTLYNVKPGSAIKISTKDNTSAFLIGTDDFEKIKEILLLHSKNKK